MYYNFKSCTKSRLPFSLFVFIFVNLCVSAYSEKYADESVWRRDAVAFIKRCDSIISLYGDHHAYAKKKKMIAEYKKVDYSHEEMRKARDAMNLFYDLDKERLRLVKLKPRQIDQKRDEGDYYIDPVYACSTSEKDSTLAAIRCRDYVISRCGNVAGSYFIWLNTCKTADVLEMATPFIVNVTEPPSDTLYASLRKLIHDALDSFPEGYGSDYDIEPLCSKPGFYPKYELQKFIWAVDTAAVLVPRLNKLYKNRNYDGIVASLRSLDTTFYGSILYHRAVFLYHCYSSVDSLILNKYEDEFRKKAQKGSAVKFDSLISQLENTRFLFPHKVALRKRQIIASFAPLSQSGSTNKVVPGNDRDKNSANSMFRCLFYGSEISKDYDFQGITIKKWLCLAPKINHSARECVFTGELSPAGFQITSPRSAIDPYVCNCKSVIKVTDELNPCLFFYNFEGVTEGPVEKAEIYDRGDLCVACIENDSCEFWYDSGRHPHFINATIQDSLYFSGEAGHFIAWIGDVNRNGKIEFIVEHSAPQMEPTVQFVEKSNKNGKIIFETKAAYERNLPEPDIE